MKLLKWGFIGCGEVTEKKSGPAFNLVEGSEVVAVMSRNKDKARSYAERHNVKKWYTDAQELIYCITSLMLSSGEVPGGTRDTMSFPVSLCWPTLAMTRSSWKSDENALHDMNIGKATTTIRKDRMYLFTWLILNN